MTSSTPRRAGLSWRGKLALALGMLPVGLGLAELGARGIALSRGRPTSPTALKEELLRAVSALVDDLPGANQLNQLEVKARQRFQPHPFTAWDTANSQAVSRQLIDGYATGRLRKHYVVVVVGGSVSGIFASAKGGAWKFEQMLEADPRFAGLDVEVFSQGRGAWKQPQQLILFSYLLSRGVEPDLIINLDGFNEVALTNTNHSLGADPLYPSMPQWIGLHLPDTDPRVQESRERTRRIKREAVLVAKRGMRGPRLYSLLWTELALSELRGLTREAGAAREEILGPGSPGAELRAVRGAAVTSSSELVIADGALNWMRSSRAMDVLCRANGIRYFHVLQPTLHDPGAKIVSDEEQRQGWIQPAWLEGVEIGYPLLRERGAELAASGVLFFDASRLFEGNSETLYYDSCHFGKQGNVLLARAMAEEFLAQLPPGRVK